VCSHSQGSLAQLSDWQIDLLIFVATNIGPMVSLKDLRVNTRGDLTFGWHLCRFIVWWHTHSETKCNCPSQMVAEEKGVPGSMQPHGEEE